MQILTITQNPATASATALSTSASPGASPLTLTAQAAAIDAAVGGRIISITSGSDDSSIHFTVVGIDQNGFSVTENITGSSGAPGTVVSTKFYKSVSSITPSGAGAAGTTTAGIVGTTLSTASTMVPLNYYSRTAAQVAVEVTGTINFTIKETFGPILTGTPTTSAAILFSSSALSAKTANTNALLDVGATGVVAIINSYSTGATLTMRVVTPSNSNLG